MPESIFDRYKDALRRGHVALLGGELEAALTAYHEAARLVPERPLPHASIGTVLARLGRADDAAAAFDQALAIAPDDEATLRARAEALGATPAPTGTPTTDPAPEQPPEPTPNLPPGPMPTEAGPDAPDGVPEPVRPPQADPAALQAAADGFLDAGEPDAAREPLLQAMAAHRAVGRLDAAIDECFQLLSVAPEDPRVHLAIADLELDHGWRAVAAEKVELLLRLTALSGDARAEADVRALAAARLETDSAVAEPLTGGAAAS